MQELNLILGQNENFTFVTVVFDNQLEVVDGIGAKKYVYKTTLQLEKSDKVIVEADGRLKVVTVHEVDVGGEIDLTAYNGYKWIVDKIDLDYYNNCLEVERNVRRNLNKLKMAQLRKETEANMTELLGEEGVQEIKKIARL
jgi:hypothetical protein